MKDLFFGVTLNNHTFSVRMHPAGILCWYKSNGKYSVSLTFAKNTYAHVSYKNLEFRGRVTKQDNWRVCLGWHPVIHKRYNMYYFESTKKRVRDNENHQPIEWEAEEYPKNILGLRDFLLEEFSEQYARIDNKEGFQALLCEHLYECYFDVKSIDEIWELENYEEDEENPVIEKVSVRETLLDEGRGFFQSFHQAELDGKSKEKLITIENIVKVVPKLQEVPHIFLLQSFKDYMEANYTELIKPGLYYRLDDELYSVGMELYDSYQCYLFANTIEERTTKIFFEMNARYADKDEICSLLKREYKDHVPSDEEFEKHARKIINDHETFGQTYNKFFSLFQTDYITVEWNDEIIQTFQKYESNDLPVASEHLAEYEVYQQIIPYFRKHFFRKNSNQYKPVIEKLPAFISYASSVFEILFRHNLLIDNEEIVDYNEDGDIESAYEELKLL